MKVISEIARDCLELPVAQRLKLARILLDLSEPAETVPPSGAESGSVDAIWDDEIAARRIAVIQGRAKSRSLEDVFAELDERYPS